MAFAIDRVAVENLVQHIIEDVAQDIEWGAEDEFKRGDEAGFADRIFESVAEQLDQPLRDLLTDVTVPA